MPAWPSVVCALLPCPKTRGCRSIEQPLARTSRTRSPVSRRMIRWAETSAAEPPSGTTAARTRVSSSSDASAVLVNSHSSGPSQTAYPDSVGTQVLGTVGRSASGHAPGSPSRTSTVATYGSTVTPTESGRPAKASLHASSGWVLSISTIATGSFGIDQHRAGDLDRDESAVDGDVDGLADARATALDQGQGEGTLEFGAAVAGGDVAEHGHRRRRQLVVDAELHDLRALRQHGLPVDRQQPDQVLAQGLLVGHAGEGPLADEVDLLLRDRPRHAQVLRRDGAVGVL